MVSGGGNSENVAANEVRVFITGHLMQISVERCLAGQLGFGYAIKLVKMGAHL